MKPFYFDIETIPAQDPAIKSELAAAVKAPGTYSKPESIAKWLDENREAEAEAAWLKTSFDGGAGHVVCIAWAVDDGMPSCVHVGGIPTADAERDLLRAFFGRVVEAGHCTFVGHNVIGFDLPFLWKRAMVLGVKPPTLFPRNPKPWSELVQDTMLLWDATERKGASMDRICRLLGIPGKEGMSGADVWPAVQEGRIDDVAAYCRGDVERTRAMFKRMTFA